MAQAAVLLVGELSAYAAALEGSLRRAASTSPSPATSTTTSALRRWTRTETLIPLTASGLHRRHGRQPFGGFGTILPTSQARSGQTYGVIKFTLHADSYDWQFIPIAGETFTDSGTTGSPRRRRRTRSRRA